MCSVLMSKRSELWIPVGIEIMVCRNKSEEEFQAKKRRKHLLLQNQLGCAKRMWHLENEHSAKLTPIPS